MDTYSADDIRPTDIRITYPVGTHTFVHDDDGSWHLDLTGPIEVAPADGEHYKVGPYDDDGVMRVLGAFVREPRVEQPEVRMPSAEDARRKLAVTLFTDQVKRQRPDSDYTADIEYLDAALVAFADQWAALMTPDEA